MAKKILHIVAGDDTWEPTKKQLKNITQLFIDANKDPSNAVVATRQGVYVSVIELGEDNTVAVEPHKPQKSFDRGLLNIEDSKERSRPIYPNNRCDVKEGCTISVGNKMYLNITQVVVDDIDRLLNKHIRQTQELATDEHYDGFSTKSIFGDSSTLTAVAEGVVHVTPELKLCINGVIYVLTPERIKAIEILLQSSFGMKTQKVEQPSGEKFNTVGKDIKGA